MLGLPNSLTAQEVKAPPSLKPTQLPDFLRFKHVVSYEAQFLGEILALHQDRYGFVWIGGKDGLSRYDGYDHKLFKHDPLDNSSISNNIINDITEDAEGNLWIATDEGLNLLNRSTLTFKRFFSTPDDITTLDHNRVITLLNENNHTLWIGGDQGMHTLDMRSHKITQYPTATSSESEKQLDGPFVMDFQLVDDVMYIATGYGLKIWDRSKQKVTRYSEPVLPGFPNAIVRAVLVDNQRRIWLGTEKGLSQLDESNGEFTFYPNPHDPVERNSAIWSIMQDSHGEIWAASDGVGIMRYDAEEDRYRSYMPNERDRYAPQAINYRVILEDSVGDLWFGAYPTGVDLVSRYNATFQTFRNTTDDNTTINAKAVGAILEGPQGQLWIGTEGGGLNIYDPITETFSVIKDEPGNRVNLGSNEIMEILYDDQGFLWLGLWDGGVTRIHLESMEIKNYPALRNSPNHLQVPHVFSLHMDSENNLWAGTMGGGLGIYDPERDIFQPFIYADDSSHLDDERVWSITEDSNKNLWLGTHHGLVKVNVKNRTTKRFRSIFEDKTTISEDWVTATLEDSKNRIWVATHGGGLNLFDPKTEIFTRIQKPEGLATELIYALVEDQEGLIWMSSNLGIMSYNPETQKVNNYSVEHGLQGNLFSLGAGTLCANGDIIFAGVNGFTRFSPAKLTPNVTQPPIVLTELMVNQLPVDISENSVIESNILMSPKITLNHKQNVFSVDFAALNYRIPNDNQYAYWLEGFDDNWQEAGRKRTKSYTNLDAGYYTFHVKASNNEGVWNDTGVSIDIEIIPAPWLSWWAYLSYITLIVALVSWYIHGQRKVIAVQNEMVHQLKQVDKLKDEFVASTSHELRTPLFGIVGLAESLIDEAKHALTHDQNNKLTMIVSSGRRLVAQVNDILDYAKIRNNALEVSIKPVNLYELCNLVIPLTRPIISGKDMILVNQVKENIPAVMADPHRLQQVLINLIANAIHHTQQGTITVKAEPIDGNMKISISDTGKGIPKDKFDALFEQFTQLENVNSREQKGTGLGLPITKKLVELQKGKIWVESEVNVGSTFSFTLPITFAHVEKTAISESEKGRISVIAERNRNQSGVRDSRDLEQPNTPNLPELEAEPEDLSAHILIVDDEKVNRIVLEAYLKHKPYTISFADSGVMALNLLEKDKTIDLVLLDIMMPGMSGFDVCRNIREQYNIDELPVLFTTAKGNNDDMEMAFRVGGNDFLNKPVERKELSARITMHLIQQFQRRHGYQDTSHSQAG